MTIMPIPSHLPPIRLLSLRRFTIPTVPTRFASMADQTLSNPQKTQSTDDLKSSINYPVPLSPPLPAMSKQIELSRAMTASSKSSLVSLSRSDVIFEDEWLIAFNKPQGVYCESVLASIPTLLTHSNDSDEPGNQVNLPELHLANRLDRDTSGVMLITKSHKVAAKLVKAFTDHKVQKTYIAFCVGRAPEWQRITIKSGHGRSKFGAWRVYATSDVGRTLPGGSVVRDMQTLFELLSVNGQGHSKESSKPDKHEEKVLVVEEKSMTDTNVKKDEILIRAYPQSGRTHQIRLHCQYLGIPIRGDVKYEGVYEWKGRMYDGHELHAESLSFEHPVTGLPVVYQAPLPLWASQALQLL
ncbi:RNA pseudouridine synthase [Actinidia chinensis var. chinensis]|uniref:RNA pseudouridine synthase n=1 Tax=Actinidia chinensis var. chinensis TaxID=1590841 RepID=A0A2R6Q1D2_ACTCC|nr:RNA pseudouridine synthase [Actinidia chinensis var. chinensis]